MSRTASIKTKLLAIGGGLLTIGALLAVRSVITDAPLERLTRTAATADGSETFRGSLHFPRGGPYVFGTECDKPCTLRIDGKPITRGQGIAKRRVVFAAGVHDVEFVRAGQGRLLWHPPGRRGPLEYVPASSLSPEPTDAASFARPGSSIADGVIALLIVAILIAMIAVLLRGVFSGGAGPGGKRERAQWLEVLAVFAVALGVRLIGLGDAGQTWDEDVNWSAGRNYITNLLGLEFADASWRFNMQHPPLMKYLVGIGAQFADGYGPARAVSATMMGLACALLVPIAARLGVARAGIYAGLVAALSPHLVGHGQIVGHESAMALTWTLAILGAVCVWPAGEGSRLEVRLGVVGAAVGLAIAARFVNGLVGPLVYAIVVLQAPAQRRVETAWKAALIMPAAAVAVFIALWPRMWTTPIEHLGEAWRILKKPHSAEPFLGAMTNAPPRSYFVIYLLVTAPLGLLVAALGGLSWSSLRKRPVALAIALWLLVPLVVTLSPVRQDGVRYIIPSLFALALAAGVGVYALEERIRHRRFAKLPALVLMLYLAGHCIAIRPHFIDYYGEHVGGPSAVAENRWFEVAWWGEGIEDGIDYLNEHAEPDARVFRCVGPSHLTWLRHDMWKINPRSPAQASWALIYAPTTTNCRLPAEFELVHEVSARGAPLMQVFRRRPPRPDERPDE